MAEQDELDISHLLTSDHHFARAQTAKSSLSGRDKQAVNGCYEV
jgi:hypothetical protein